VKVLFRCDSSSAIGLGHVMRDLVLADEYKKDEIYFACQSLEGNVNKTIPYPVHELKSNKPEEIISLIISLHVNLLIIDHYGIDYETEKIIKDKTGIKICCFDDDYREHFCDEIINHNISANISKYKNPDIVRIIPPLIRNEFKKEKIIQREKIYDIFLAIGGTDHSNINISILKCLPNSLHVNVITTTANKNLAELRKFVACRCNISLHVNSKEIAKMMNQSKFAIVTPSVMVHEVLFMNIPFLAIKTASNQDDMYIYLKNNGQIILDIFEKNIFKQKIKDICWNPY